MITLDNRLGRFTETQDPREISITESRITQLIGTAISIQGGTDRDHLHYTIKIGDNRIQNVGTESRIYLIPAFSDEEAKSKKQEKIDIAKAY
jgi:hypothetical protein